MKRTYTPSIEDLCSKYGNEDYFTVTATRRGCKSDSKMTYGTLDDVISLMDSYIFSAYGDDADLGRYSARISHDGRDLVYFARVGDGPDSARVLPQPTSAQSVIA